MSSSAALGARRRGIRRPRPGLPRSPRAARREASTEGHVHRPTEALAELILQIDQVEQAERSVPREVDQQIHVALRPRLAARHQPNRLRWMTPRAQLRRLLMQDAQHPLALGELGGWGLAFCDYRE